MSKEILSDFVPGRFIGPGVFLICRPSERFDGDR